VRYAAVMRHPDGGGLGAAERARRFKVVEQVWSHLKRSLANLTKRNLSQLTALIKSRLRRMQYRPSLLASTRLDLTPFCNPRC
jgi:hypothetical protein